MSPTLIGPELDNIDKATKDNVLIKKNKPLGLKNK